MSRAPKSRATKTWNIWLPFALALIIASQAIAGLRRIEISTFVDVGSTSAISEARLYFAQDYRYGGGIVPRGTASFFDPDGNKLNPSELTLVVIDRDKVRNGRPDHDAIGIKWKGDVFVLSANDIALCPLIRFVDRDAYIAFTFPVAGVDQKYFKANHLWRVPGVQFRGFAGFVAEEFLHLDWYCRLLSWIDLYTETEPLPPATKQDVMDTINGVDLRVDTLRAGSYVNADFHVNYKVFLESDNNANHADVGGLPLRYYWRIGLDKRAVVHDVKVFSFPKKEEGLQYEAIIFFQTAAILRQFKEDNPHEYNRFLAEVCALTAM